MKRVIIYCGVLLILSACLKMESSDGNQTNVQEPTQVIEPKTTKGYTSLLGKELIKPEISSRELSKRKRQLNLAKIAFDQNLDSLDSYVWLGRRLAYLYEYDSAIKVFSSGLSKFPEAYQLYRHRGHRYITTRQFEKAISDLTQAAFFIRNRPIEIEKDGLPNKRNIPRTTVQFNIWYHLGLVYYLKGDYDKAISAYKKCLEISDNDDMLVAATDWLYMTYRKIGNSESANSLLTDIKRRMDIMENNSYHNRLLMYQGKKEPSELFDLNQSKSNIYLITQGYGVGNWYYYNGQTNKALEIFEKLIESESWHAFGYLAAEVELYNIRNSGS